MRIRNISAQQIFDSRGEPTIEVSLVDGAKRISRGAVPAGKSRGRNEARVFGFRDAVRSAKKIERALRGKNFSSVRAVDRSLLTLDGTANKAKLGGNVTLGVSLAASRAVAAEQEKELWQSLRDEYFKNAASRTPLIFSNLINGGAHAEDNLAIQEYMVVVRPAPSLQNGIEALIRFYRDLGAFIKKARKIHPVPIGDEDGYAVNFRSNFEPVALLAKLIKKNHLEKRFLLALDAAATNFHSSGVYRFGGRRLGTAELAAVYTRYFKNSELLFSVEDPFAERDTAGFILLREKLPYAWVVGDDLTTTNSKAIERAAHRRAINAVIIKPNQIGTVSEACEAIRVAKIHGLKTIISHRSGETSDHFIIHLARAADADGVKIGAPVNERMEKFNELLRVWSGRPV